MATEEEEEEGDSDEEYDIDGELPRGALLRTLSSCCTGWFSTGRPVG